MRLDVRHRRKPVHQSQRGDAKLRYGFLIVFETHTVVRDQQGNSNPGSEARHLWEANRGQTSGRGEDQTGG